MTKTYMIIEHFKAGCAGELYRRFDEQGRLLPDGVTYVNSWIDEGVERCFQVIESESREKIDEWIGQWADLAEFEVIPVLSSEEARRKARGG